jgi:hypothetical protein
MVAADFRVPDVRQTPWSCGHNGATWYACVHADIDDEVVIETAKRLVDHALPQKLSTFFGGHYYSFVTREYLLNLLLFYYQEHGLFPVGSVCVVERWPWDGQIFKSNGKWFNSWAWRFSTTRAELKAPGYWVQIPPVSRVIMKETTSDTQEPQQSQIGIL